MEIKNDHPIDSLYVVVSVDGDGNEGIYGEMLGASWFPFVTSNHRLVPKMIETCEGVKKEKGIPYKVLHFTNPKDVTEQFKL